MKLFACFLSLSVLMNVACLSKPATNQTKPVIVNASPPAKIPQNSSDQLKKLAREQGLVDSKKQLAKDGIDASLGGADKDILILKSSKLSNFEILSMVRDGLEVFREAGYVRIEITDASGEMRTVDLTALDIP